MAPTVLIANRGVIARRILRSTRALGWKAAAVYSEADRESPAVREADLAVCIGPPAPAASYLNAASLLHAAKVANANILHPGYGFLSENADFCEACEREGIAFAGPTPEQIRLFGLKNTAREQARSCGLPLLPGTELLETPAEALAAAEAIGYPVMLKSTAGGGGIGMRVCRHEGDLREAYEGVRRLGEANFRHAGVFLEKFISCARHVEVQIFGDGNGRVLVLGERDCSIQRRNQKVIEETPAPGLSEGVRSELHACARRLGESVAYRSAGTVEFLYDAREEKFYFLEVNTRLQVEHGVTEEVFGIDLVEWMLRLAAGDTSFFPNSPLRPRGASIQARLYAEVPSHNFQPSTGLITHAHFPKELRVETWVESGSEVTPFYDPMLAKLIATGQTREEAVSKLEQGLAATRIDGIETNLAYLREILKARAFQMGEVSTSFLRSFTFTPAFVEVLEGGIETLVVDWPGRVGFWEVGVPPSGPFDDRSFRAANRALGNPEGAPGLEMTLRGPTLKFYQSAWCCVCGADMQATVDGKAVEWGKPFLVRAGQVLAFGSIQGAGMRAYLAVRGGWQVPKYLGSATTFRLGGFGGHGGRALRGGDFLRLGEDAATPPPATAPAPAIEAWSHEWTLAVSYGPHGAPDFFTEDFIGEFFETSWEVHYNSARTGIRLIGPKPKWARADGGEAGLHPSNIHDNAYQVGAIDFTGDMPILLGPDGPSLGGFVCPAVVLREEMWKAGQMRPGDRVRFHPVAWQDRSRGLAAPAVLEPPATVEEGEVCYRRQGDTGILVEYGPMVLDLGLRLRAQALYERLKSEKIPGLRDLTPGIRSLQVRFEPAEISYPQILDTLRKIERELPPMQDVRVASRVVHLPLSWDDPATQLAIRKYMQSVRRDAPWCPSNLEFIRRINGLESVKDVSQIVFEAAYLVLGLGDVYLGAPVATPVDPRHRLVTTKYNPARTWTPENAVGIGGAYLCIYGMEGPGGYQFVGRTVPVWNRFRTTPCFEPGKPWLLRFFDQIRFYPVTHEELQDLRVDILSGRFVPKIEPTEFCYADYLRFLEQEKRSIADFQEKQRRAFAEERERWRQAGKDEATIKEALENNIGQPATLPAHLLPVTSPASGSIWKILVQPGQRVSQGETVAILESMKMEIACPAPAPATVREVCVKEGMTVLPGQVLIGLET